MKSLFTLVLFFSTVAGFSQRFNWVEFHADPNNGSTPLALQGLVSDGSEFVYSVTLFNDLIIAGTDTLQSGGNPTRPDFLISKWNADGELVKYRQAYDFSNNGYPVPGRMAFDAFTGTFLLSTMGLNGVAPLTFLATDTQAETTTMVGTGNIIRFNSDLDVVSVLSTPSYGAAHYPLTAGDSSLYVGSGYNGIVSKYDAQDNLIWSVESANLGSSHFDISDIAYVNDSVIYVLGYYSDDAMLNQGVTFGGVHVAPSIAGGSGGIILYKMDNLGVVESGTYLGYGYSYTSPMHMVADEAGNVYIAATYSGASVDMGGLTLEPSIAASDGFVIKLNDQLQAIWARAFHHASGNMETRTLSLGDSGKLFLTGSYGGVASFGGFNLVNSPYGTCYLAEFDSSNGDVLYATNYGSLGAGTGRPYGMDRIGNKYFVGGLSYGASLSDDFAQAQYGCFAQTRSSAFIACFEDVPFLSPDVALSYSGQELVAIANSDEGVYSWYYNNVLVEGATSSTLALIGEGNYAVTYAIHACAATDVYSYCSVNAMDTQEACNAFTWIDGTTYFESNSTAVFHLQTAGGCDSIVHLQLTLHSIPVSLQFDQLTNTIYTDYLGAESYQWNICSKGMSPIQGAVQSEYVVQENGLYSLTIGDFNCEVTTDCIGVVVIGVSESATLNKVQTYPNPASDKLFCTGLEAGSRLDLMDSKGSLVLHYRAITSTQELDVTSLSAGIYFLRVSSNNAVEVKAITIE